MTFIDCPFARRGAEFSAQIFSTNFQRGSDANADSQCTNFNSNNLRVVSPLVYNIYSVVVTYTLFISVNKLTHDDRWYTHKFLG